MGAADNPDAVKVHRPRIPRMGGMPFVIGWLVPFMLYVHINRQFLGLLAGVVVLFALGLYDDIKGLKASHKLLWQVLAAGIVLAGGIGIIYFTNPAGGVFRLDFWRIAVHLGSLHFNILPIA